MKHLLTIVITIFLFQLSYGQKVIKRDTIYPEEQTQTFKSKLPKSDVETLFPNQKSFGGYYSVSMGYSLIDNKDAVVVGSRLMMVTNHYLGIGFGGKAFIASPTKIKYDDQSASTYITLGGGYGGMFIEPVLYSLKPVHVAFPILVGAGGVIKDQWTEDFDSYDHRRHSEDIGSVYFIVEPGIDVEFNIAKWFRIGLGASYRVTSEITGLGDDAAGNLLEGFNYGMTFKLGWF